VPRTLHVEEALCFGWIDGLVRTVDQAYYAQRFTPRRPGSKWSDLNRARLEKLLRSRSRARPCMTGTVAYALALPTDSSRKRVGVSVPVRGLLPQPGRRWSFTGSGRRFSGWVDRGTW
jgi:hypothetical protein